MATICRLLPSRASPWLMPSRCARSVQPVRPRYDRRRPGRALLAGTSPRSTPYLDSNRDWVGSSRRAGGRATPADGRPSIHKNDHRRRRSSSFALCVFIQTTSFQVAPRHSRSLHIIPGRCTSLQVAPRHSWSLHIIPGRFAHPRIYSQEQVSRLQEITLLRITEQ